MVSKSVLSTVLCVTLLAVFIGCGSSNPMSNPPVVSAAGPAPFPTMPAVGGTIMLEPGVYACPASIPTSTHIIGHGAIVPPELLASTKFAPLATNGTVSVVRVVCPHGLTIKDVSDINISGVVFDFQGGGGLVLDSVTFSRFDMALFDADTALTLTANDGNNMSNTFPRLTLYQHNVGIVLRAQNSRGVTWNDFGHVDIIDTRATGIIISQFADTNTFDAVRMHLLGSAQDGVIFNDAAVLGDVDASGNTFGLLSCDGEPGFVGACAHFKGYTVGNRVRMGFGIMPDANKILFDNAFSAASNTVEKMQEHPKTP